jgi:hypothetical protein
MFKQNPEALVLWAHSGFEQVEKVRAMVTKHKTLWADVALRTDHAPSGKLDATWKQLFVDFPERFMVGTDTYTPSAGTTWSSTPTTRASGSTSCPPSSPTTSPSATPSGWRRGPWGNE